MKILFDHPNPFFLAHGGFQIQIQQTYRGLREIGVEVDYLRWWDDRQPADVIHFFGRPSVQYLEHAHAKGIKVVVAELLSGTGSRSRTLLRVQRAAVQLAQRLLPKMFTARFGWEAFRRADACVAITQWEAHLMHYIFGAPADRLHVIPYGIETEFIKSATIPRGPLLVCSATITERKRVLELAQAAVIARTPLWIIGKPYAPSDPYALKFTAFARQHSDLIRYEGAIHDRAKLAQAYREARGFVLLSTQETLSLSALEAAACQCPLLLSDLPWAHAGFSNAASYVPSNASTTRTAGILRSFYDRAPSLPVALQPPSWQDVASQFRDLYSKVLRKAQ